MRLHYLQHVHFENLGSIFTWATKEGCSITSTHLYNHENLPAQSDFDWLVVMGGPMNIYQEDKYPWLVSEKQFIREAIKSGKVVIGICLGAQLIADVIGGEITRNPCPEIGWFPIKLKEEARSSLLFSFLPEEPMVFQWHGDTFSTLPEDAVCLAESDACHNQAFVYKDRVFGFQFHLESTQETIGNLVNHCIEEMVPGDFVQTPEEVLSHPEYVDQDNQWMDIFLTQLKMKEMK
jgi:GMP synthase-like glutamine amidotransferase